MTPTELMDATLRELPCCKGVTLFKLEPFVLHVRLVSLAHSQVQCRSPEKAQEMLTLAVAAGFRESGILLGRRTILGFRTTANSMEVPVAENGKLLVSKEYLEYVVNYGNAKFQDNLRRIGVFFASVGAGRGREEKVKATFPQEEEQSSKKRRIQID